MKFAVSVMPPVRSTAVSGPLTPLSSAPNSSSIDSIHTLAVSGKSSLTISDLIHATEQRFREAYGDDVIKGLVFGTKLKGLLGEDYLPTDELSDLFEAEGRRERIQLYLYLEEGKSKEGNPKKRKRDEESEAEVEPLAKRTKGKRVVSTAQAKANASKPDWTEEEDEVILKGVRAGWNSKKIAQSLDSGLRTAGAVRGRKAVLMKRKPDLRSFAPPLRGGAVAKPARSNVLASAPPPAVEAPPLAAANTTAQPEGNAVVVTTPPRPSDMNIFIDRTDKERWAEAYEDADGDSDKARYKYNVIVNREAMLNAVMREDQPEIERLKAQRHRLKRERNDFIGATTPSRHDRLAGHAHLPSNSEAADEEVVRDDDYSTSEEGRANSMSMWDTSEDEMEDEEDDSEGTSAENVHIVVGPGKILEEEEDEDVKEAPKDSAEPRQPSQNPANDEPEAKAEAKMVKQEETEEATIYNFAAHFRPTPPRPRPVPETAEEARARLMKLACPYGDDEESSESSDSD
ncbi:hypothetical protein AC578_837 [Pseudocercospora eumusae]|uniref:Uncharacterized protein n=1 Tax=Pseudocercospora eumusae TaxID=321146 RepID=A0A139GZP2_9PEZI|nr:hypothetical protein AC578_837 [Pseudocercospora eumusae]